jgi:hypothetical protein
MDVETLQTLVCKVSAMGSFVHAEKNGLRLRCAG